MNETGADIPAPVENRPTWGLTIEHHPEYEKHLTVRDVLDTPPQPQNDIYEHGTPVYWTGGLDYKMLTSTISSDFESRAITANKKSAVPYPKEQMVENSVPSQYTESFEFRAWGESVRLYNYANKELTDEQLRQISDSLGIVAQKTGGLIFNKLNQIVILPEDNPLLNSTGQDGRGRVDGGWNNKIVILNGSLLGKHRKETAPHPVKFEAVEQPYFTAKERTQRKIAKTLLGRRTHKQQEIEERRIEENDRRERQRILSMLPRSIGGTLEGVLLHELHHGIQRAAPKEHTKFRETVKEAGEIAPSRYAYKVNAKGKHLEHFPEVGAALARGPDWAMLVGPKHEKAYKDFLAGAHQGVAGPTIITCRQLDLKSLTTPQLERIVPPQEQEKPPIKIAA